LVILLHGFPEFWFAWRHYFEPLVRAGYRVVAPDQRGYNLSEKPRKVGAYKIDRLAEDVLELARWEGAESFRLVGHDWGGAVAWRTAQRRPQAIERMVIMNLPHPAVMRKHLLGSFEQIRRSWYMFWFQLPWLPETMVMADGGRTFYAKMAATSNPGCFGEDELDAYMHAWGQPGAFRSMLHWYRSAIREGLLGGETGEGRISVPTSILWGRRDRILVPQLASESLEYCDDASLRFFDDATHWVNHEEREAVLEDMLRFFRD
jgi:pimeloyl-ACP methyl ester carboxylesterase